MKKKIVAKLLLFFIGAFGIHKFYLGQTNAGMVLLLGFCFVWILGIPSLIIGVIAFIEAVIYLTRSEDSFYEIYVFGRKS